ncbi:hypothetical protein [Sphingopyxis sp.]|uniref:hypothetical protein n=1 Tax=Sphingopyxis sp. TaxID=1908224 RepID=UPI003D0CF4FE
MPLFRSILAALLFAIAVTGSAAAAPICAASGAASGCCDEKRPACPMVGPACRAVCAAAITTFSLGFATTLAANAPLPFSIIVGASEGRMIRPPLPPPRATSV